MFVELNPGTQAARRWPRRLDDPGRQHAARRQPRRDPVARSTPTRATTCSCWSTAPAQGLQGPRQRPADGVRALRADPPRPRRVNAAVAERHANLAPPDPLAERAQRRAGPARPAAHPAGRRPPRRCSARFASEDGNIARGRPSCPARCARRRRRWARSSASPTCSARRARPAPGRARAGHRQPRDDARSPRRRRRSLKNQIRPFVRDARPLVRSAAAGRANLAKATPDLTTHASRSSTTSSTCSATTRTARRTRSRTPAATRATCSGSPGSTTTAPRCSATADANGAFRPVTVGGTCGDAQAARQTRTSAGPDRAAPSPGRAHRRPRPTPAGRERTLSDAEASPDLRPDAHDGAVRAVVLRAAAVPVAGLRRRRSRSSPRATASRSRSPRRRSSAEQADVRIAGVTVGKVVKKDIDPAAPEHDGRDDRARSEVRADAHRRARDPAPEDAARRDLRRADAGRPQSAPVLKDGGWLARRQVRQDRRARRDLPGVRPGTRQAFRTWQQDLAEGVDGQRPGPQRRARQPAAVRASGDRRARRARRQSQRASAGWCSNTGVVFSAISATRRSCTTWSSTPATVFRRRPRSAGRRWPRRSRIFPTFLDESKATLARLQTFAHEHRPADPRPAPGRARPARRRCATSRRFAPDLRNTFVNLDPLITASKTGLPALRDTAQRREAAARRARSRSSSSSTRSCSTSSSTRRRRRSSSPTAERPGGDTDDRDHATRSGHYLRQFGPGRPGVASPPTAALAAPTAATPTSAPPRCRALSSTRT